MTASRLTNLVRNPAAIRLLKLVLTVGVLVALIRYILRTWRDLDAHQIALTISWPSLVVAAGLYLGGLWAQGTFFGLTLARGLTPIGSYPAIRAYLISHLAKYVPGKAMVVVVRSALCAEAGARPASAAFATLYETLVMMAAGGLVAAGGFGLKPSPARIEVFEQFGPVQLDWAGPSTLLALPALVIGLGLLALVLPATFPRVAGLIRRPLRGVGADSVPQLSGGLLVQGFFWSATGWILLGLSLVAVVASIEAPAPPRPLVLSEAILVMASVALATVAGFVVPIAPGGLGVREWVLWTTLGTIIPHDRAVVSATLLRLVWVAAEIVAAAILWPIRPPRLRVSPPTPPEPGALA